MDCLWCCGNSRGRLKKLQTSFHGRSDDGGRLRKAYAVVRRVRWCRAFGRARRYTGEFRQFQRMFRIYTTFQENELTIRRMDLGAIVYGTTACSSGESPSKALNCGCSIGGKGFSVKNLFTRSCTMKM